MNILNVINIKNAINLIPSGICGFLSYFLGGLDGLLTFLIIAIVIDYGSGIMIAITKKELCSEIGFKGIFKKVLIFAFVGIGNLVDLYITKNSGVIRAIVITFYISNEAISIIENASNLGLPVPKKLKNILKQLNQDDEV